VYYLGELYVIVLPSKEKILILNLHQNRPALCTTSLEFHALSSVLPEDNNCNYWGLISLL
jgi:hypothetical protein